MLKDKTVRVEHLVYMIIIFVITLSFFLVIAFGEMPGSNNMLAVAGTVSSIILAVIAIVMSLIDVAGQRQSIIDLKETAESLSKTTIYTQDKMEETVKQLENLQMLKDHLVENIQEYKYFKDDVLTKLNEISNNDPENLSQTIKEIIEDTKNDEEKLVSKDYLTNFNQYFHRNQKPTSPTVYVEIRNIIIEYLSSLEKGLYSLDDIILELSVKTNNDFNIIKNILKSISHRDKSMFIDYESNTIRKK